MYRCKPINALFSSLVIAAALFTGTRVLAKDTGLAFPSPSSFDGSRITREPFAPLDEGRLASGPVIVSAVGDGVKAGLESLFRVTTISLGRYSLAVINNATFATGEKFFLKIGAKTVMVSVVSIKDGSVDLDCGGKRVKAPLQVALPESTKQE